LALGGGRDTLAVQAQRPPLCQACPARKPRPPPKVRGLLVGPDTRSSQRASNNGGLRHLTSEGQASNSLCPGHGERLAVPSPFPIPFYMYMHVRITAAAVDPSPGVTCLLGRAHSTLPCFMFHLHFLANYQQPVSAVFTKTSPHHSRRYTARSRGIPGRGLSQPAPPAEPPPFQTPGPCRFLTACRVEGKRASSPFPCVIAARLAGKITDWGFAIPRHRLPSRNRSNACSLGSNHHIHNPVATPHICLRSISPPCRGSLHKSSAEARVPAPHLGVTQSRGQPRFPSV
jgi:hypothetical protein